MDIGFVGLGNIGLPMAERLVGAGRSIVGFDLRSERIKALAACGGLSASSVAEVGERCEIVFASLPGPESALRALVGSEGVSEGTAIKYLVDLSTIGSPTAKRIAAALAAKSVTYVDSPVSGGPAPAIKGKLTIMTACSEDALEVVNPYLETLGTVYHVGREPGMAQMMKLVNNILSATAMAISCEAIGLGARAGLDPTVMVRIASSGTGRNSALQDKFPASILTRKFDWGFSTGMMCKDLRLALQEAESLGLPMLVASAVRQMWLVLMREMGPESDITTMMKLVEAWGGAPQSKVA